MSVWGNGIYRIMTKRKYIPNVVVPTLKEQKKAFKQRMAQDPLPYDYWRDNPRFEMDRPAKGLLFDLERRCFTDPFWYKLGFATWRDEKEILT